MQSSQPKQAHPTDDVIFCASLHWITTTTTLDKKYSTRKFFNLGVPI